MFINKEKLESKGYRINVDKKGNIEIGSQFGVDIFGEVADTIKREEFGLSLADIEGLVFEFTKNVEKKIIVNLFD